MTTQASALSDGPARPRRNVGVVVALLVGYLGAVTLGAYVFGGSVIDAMRAQQTADVAAALPEQELLTLLVAQERSLATVVHRSCAPNLDCALAAEAQTALLDGVPELDQDGEPVVGTDGNVVFAQPAAVQQTATALARRDQIIGAIDIGMLDARVRNAVVAALGSGAAVEQVHRTVEASPGDAVEAYNKYLQDAAGPSESLAAVTDGELGARLEAQRLQHELLIANLYERPLVGIALSASDAGQPGQLEPAAAQVAAVDEQVAEAKTALDRTTSAQRLPAIDGDLAVVRSAVRSGALSTLTPAQTQGFVSESAAWFEEMRLVRDAFRAETLELADEQATVAIDRALLTGAIIAGVLIVGLIAVIVGSVLLLRRRRTPPTAPVVLEPSAPAALR